jgi:hypothetical protein
MTRGTTTSITKATPSVMSNSALPPRRPTRQASATTSRETAAIVPKPDCRCRRELDSITPDRALSGSAMTLGVPSSPTDGSLNLRPQERQAGAASSTSSAH